MPELVKIFRRPKMPEVTGNIIFLANSPTTFFRFFTMGLGWDFHEKWYVVDHFTPYIRKEKNR